MRAATARQAKQAPALRLVHSRRAIEKQPDTLRPFRLWDENEKKALRWRYYSDPRRAHIGALIEARWAKVGAVIAVVDVSVGRLLGQYRRNLNDVSFTR